MFIEQRLFEYFASIKIINNYYKVVPTKTEKKAYDYLKDSQKTIRWCIEIP